MAMPFRRAKRCRCFLWSNAEDDDKLKIASAKANSIQVHGHALAKGAAVG